eukprot:scaffold105199_cov43-Phaeocystis_antarctica.AAC.1
MEIYVSAQLSRSSPAQGVNTVRARSVLRPRASPVHVVEVVEGLGDARVGEGGLLQLAQGARDRAVHLVRVRVRVRVGGGGMGVRVGVRVSAVVRTSLEVQPRALHISRRL